MEEMTGRERIGNILQREPVDRIGLFEQFWSDTREAWIGAGKIGEETDLETHFGFDMGLCWTFNLVADLDHVPEIVEETEDTVLTRDGNGALLRRHKKHDSTPEHVSFAVTDRESWEELTKPKLKAEPRRIDVESYRRARKRAKENDRFFCWAGVNVFELMHPVCGHEHMLAGMALDPDFIRDMVDTYSRITIELQEILFEAEGYPDGIWFYEDMGFKERPFMSPSMYKELIQPGHKRTIDFAKSLDLPVVMHSCGMVAPLVPHMMEAGIDCLQVIEVKAGMDLLQLYKDFGDRLSFMGGIDVRVICAGDISEIDKELESKIPQVMGNYGYVFHSDHSIPSSADYDVYKYTVDKALELGTYR